MSANLKILMTEPIHQVGVDLIEQRDDVELIAAPDTSIETLTALAADVDAMAIRTALIPAEVLVGAARLKVVSRHGVGCDNVDVAHLSARGIPVAIAAGANAASVAEHTLMLMLACTRSLPKQDRTVRDGRFTARDRLVGGDLDGATVLIVGFGRVGKQVAHRCKAMGMNVTVADIKLDRVLAEESGYRDVTDFGPELGQADFLSLHVPLDTATRNLIDSAELSELPAGAIVINCARGGVIDETALVDALESNQVHAAGIDIFENEPPDSDHPFFQRSDVILTPHTAAASRRSMQEMSRMTMQNILDCFDGRLSEDCIFNLDDLKR